MSPQYCGEKHLHVLRAGAERRWSEAITQNKRIQSRIQDTFACQLSNTEEGISTSVFVWIQSQCLHNGKVSLVSSFTQAPSFIPANLLQHAGSAARKHATKSHLIHPPAAGFAESAATKIAAKCHSNIAERPHKTNICMFCRTRRDETLIQSARRPSWFLGTDEDSQRHQDLPQSPITTTATSIYTILITSPQSRPAVAAQTQTSE